MPITILLVDDHPLFRKGLHLLFDEESDMQVVGEAGDGQEAIVQTRELSPDVVVMDITMPGLNGIEATRQIIAESPGTKIVAMSIHDGKQFIKDMLEAGAAGYILKDTVPEELPACVRKVMKGEVCLSATITGVVVSELVNLIAGNGEAEKQPASHVFESVDSNGSIVKTKLFRPPCPNGYVPRQRLSDKLDMGVNCTLTLISAPAGYGKSVLVSSWLESNDRLHAWLSLDEEFKDLTTFLNYFIAAVREIFPKTCSGSYALVNEPGQVSVHVLSEQLSNDLLELKTPFIFVCDDYGRIHASDIHKMFDRLFKLLPQNLQLVFVTRRDPPFSLASMRAHGEVIDIRMTDLKFTAPEIAEFFSCRGSEPLDEKALATVSKVTEGWPAALRLLQINLAQGQDPNEFLRDMCGDSRDTHEFLVTEVLSHQTPELRNCLLKTSILNRFNASLCAVLCEKDHDGEEFIQQLFNANLFCIPLDDAHDWVRYHHLFQNLLRVHLDRRYSEDEIRELHRKASGWFEENGYLEEALYYALKADPPGKAAEVIVRHRLDIVEKEQWALLAKLLDSLPEKTISQDVELLILSARSCNKRGVYTEWVQKLDQIETILSNPKYCHADKNRQIGETCVMRCALHYHGAQGQQALALAERALELLPPESQSERAYALLIQATSRQMIGDLQAAYDGVYEALHKEAKESPTVHGRLLQALCFMQWMDADMYALKQSATAMLDLCRTHHLPETKTFAHCFLGKAQYQLNELRECEQTLRPIVTDLHGPNFQMFCKSTQILSFCYEAQGRTDAARKLSESLIDRILKGAGSSFLNEAKALEAELDLRQGHQVKARHWAEGVSREAAPVGYNVMIPDLTIAKILVLQKTTESLRQAENLLSSLHTFFHSVHNIRFLIETFSLQALLFDAMGNASIADEKLTEALALAEPGGAIRVFVDLGEGIASILTRLDKSRTASDYVQTLRAAFESTASDTESRTATSESTSQMSNQQALLESDLTNREIEILTLLAQRLRNKEIADKLFISPGTVKQHTINLYKKLGVESRREAVAKALSMNLLPKP